MDTTEMIDPVTGEIIDEQQLAEQLLKQAKEQGVDLLGPDGLLNGFDEAGVGDGAGCGDDRAPRPRQAPARRGWQHPQRDQSEDGAHRGRPVQIDVPRDRDGSFDPKIVKKRQRRLTGVDEIVLSLTARGLTTGEVAAHFDDVYGASVSKDTISRITDKVIEEMTEWQNRPLDHVYPVVFIDALVVKVRDGQVRNKPFYIAVGVTVNGERDILGIWAGDGGEGAKFWLGVMTEIKNRGAEDVCIVVCDGLKGLPESINTAWPLATVQTCIIHLIRNTFRFASRHYWEEMGKVLRPVYTAPTEAAAAERFREFDAKWGQQYPAITKLWQNAWAEFVPFLDWDVEIRRVICSTNAIEPLNARYRRAVRARGRFPNDAAALKCLYPVTRSLDPTGRGRARWATRWKPALNAFAIAFEGRIY